MCVQTQGVVGQFEAFGAGNALLALFNVRIKKFLDPAAVQADQMVVVLPFVQFVDRFATFEMAAAEDARLLELCQHAIDRGQSHIHVFHQGLPIDIVRCHVAQRRLLEQFQNFQSWQGGFEARALEFVNRWHTGHGVSGSHSWKVGIQGGRRYNDRIISCVFTGMPTFLNPLKHRLLLGGLLCLSACSSLQKPMEEVSHKVSDVSGRVAEAFRPYRTEVVQGNVVTREQLQLLRPGMSRMQVRDLLGTPLITSVFHANRWDYAFTIRRQGAEPLHRKLSVFFEGEAMARVESDELPLEAEFAARLDTRRPSGKPPVLEASPEALSTFKSRAPAATSASPASQAPLPDYPPLEPGR